MDPVGVLQNRIDQLESKLGLPSDVNQGDSLSIAENLLNVSNTVTNAVTGNAKLGEAMQRATELNNYTDPHYVDNVQEIEIKRNAIESAEPLILRHCHCASHCKKAIQVMNSEPMQAVPKMQPVLDKAKIQLEELKNESETITHGVQQLAVTCGTAANEASEAIVNAALRVEAAEDKTPTRSLPRRNGLDE